MMLFNQISMLAVLMAFRYCWREANCEGIDEKSSRAISIKAGADTFTSAY